jgi:hypothetical protein
MFPRALPWALAPLVCLAAGCFDDLKLYVPPEDASSDGSSSAPDLGHDTPPPPDLASMPDAAPDQAAPADTAPDVTADIAAEAPQPDAGPTDVAQDLPPDLAADRSPDTTPDLLPAGSSCISTTECAGPGAECAVERYMRASDDTCTSGWRGMIPPCGERAAWADMSEDGAGGCHANEYLQLQTCHCKVHPQ